MTNQGVDRCYTRVSLDRKESGSIGKQRAREAAAVAATGRDPDLIEWYEDRSVSGSKIAFADRPEGGRLLRDLRQGDRVMFTKIDRAARNVRDLLDLLTTVQGKGASIRFIDNDINTEGPWGKFMVTLLGAIAELEADIIGERRMESLQAFKDEGRHAVGKAPVGLMSAPNPNGRGLVIVKDPEVAPLVYDAAMKVTAGATLESVREPLGLSSTGIKHLLTNPRLAGMTPDGDGVVLVNGVPRIDAEAAILSLEEWLALQDVLNAGAPRRKWVRKGYGRALTCATCGRRLYRAESKYAVYRCAGKEHAGAGNGRPNIMVHAADAFIESEFIRRYGNLPHTTVKWVDESGPRTEAISLAMVAIQEITRRMGVTSDPDELVSLSQELVELHKQRAAAEALPIDRVRVEEETGRTIGEIWSEADDAEREDLILSVGTFHVRPGRIPFDKKIRFVPSRDTNKPGVSLSEAFNRIRTGLLTTHDVQQGGTE